MSESRVCEHGYVYDCPDCRKETREFIRATMPPTRREEPAASPAAACWCERLRLEGAGADAICPACLTRELAVTRATNVRLNRRCQLAEAALEQTAAINQRSTPALRNYYFEKGREHSKAEIARLTQAQETLQGRVVELETVCLEWDGIYEKAVAGLTIRDEQIIELTGQVETLTQEQARLTEKLEWVWRVIRGEAITDAAESLDVVRGLMKALVDARCDGHGDGQTHVIADVNAGLADGMIQPRLKVAEAACETLRTQLKRYGQHDEKCAVWSEGVIKRERCSCGLEAALASGPRPETKEK